MIVRWTRRALGDLERIAEHIAGDNPLAAVEFAAAVQDRADAVLPLVARGSAVDSPPAAAQPVAPALTFSRQACSSGSV